MNNCGNRRGVALPLVLIFMAAFSVLAMGMLIVGMDEMKLVSNFEYGVRAFYLAEAAANEAAAGFLDTGSAGPYSYGFAGEGNMATAQIIPTESGQRRIKATGCSGGITKHVQMEIKTDAGSLILLNWRDYGPDD